MADETSEGQQLDEPVANGTSAGAGDGVVDDTRNEQDTENNPSSSESCMAKGLSSLISSVIKDFDAKAEATLSSQNQLSFALDRLTAELDQLLDDAQLPFVMQHAARISVVRKRVTSLNSVLKSVQRRLDNIDRLMSSASAKGNSGSIDNKRTQL